MPRLASCTSLALPSDRIRIALPLLAVISLEFLGAKDAEFLIAVWGVLPANPAVRPGVG
jgi:hypothetical protein